MTDKQITIDGVDVSGCDFCEWKSSDIPQCRTRLASFESTCKGYNCYYKQLKRKEQECEELKKTLIEIKEIAEILASMTDEYENCYDRDRCFECDFTDDCSYFNTKRIIQICDEAINE